MRGLQGTIAIHVPIELNPSAPGSAYKARRRLVRLFVAGVLCLHAFFFITLRERVQQGYPDFTVFYTAATVLRHGLGYHLYDVHVQDEIQKGFAGQIPSRHSPLPYIHPPFEALVFLPLTLLPYDQAFWAWDLMNVVMLFGVAWSLRRSVSTLRFISTWEFVAGSLAFFPIFACLFQGQDSILLLLLCTLAFHALKREAGFLAGCWLALATFKFQLAIPIVLLFIIWKRKRVATGFAAMAVLLTFVSVLVVGRHALLHYPAYVLQVANTQGLGGVPPALEPNLRGLALGWPFVSKAVGITVAVLSSVLAFVFAATRGGRSAEPGNLELQFSLAIVVSVLIGWQTNVHDLSLLVLPLVLIPNYGADYGAHAPQGQSGNRLAMLLVVLPILISPFWFVLWLACGAVNVMAIPLLGWVWQIGKEFSLGVDVTGSLNLPTPR